MSNLEKSRKKGSWKYTKGTLWQQRTNSDSKLPCIDFFASPKFSCSSGNSTSSRCSVCDLLFLLLPQIVNSSSTLLRYASKVKSELSESPSCYTCRTVLLKRQCDRAQRDDKMKLAAVWEMFSGIGSEMSSLMFVMYYPERRMGLLRWSSFCWISTSNGSIYVCLSKYNLDIARLNMDARELDFSEDCVIRFDELGEYKDYTETLDAIAVGLRRLIAHEVATVPVELEEVLKVDPQEFIELPNFHEVLRLILALLKTNYQWGSTNRLHQLFFSVLEQNSLGYRHADSIEPKIVEYFQDCPKTDLHLQVAALSFVFKLSSRVIFIDQLDDFLSLFSIIDEQFLFSAETAVLKQQTGQDKDRLMAMYIDAIEKISRFRKIREKAQLRLNSFQRMKVFLLKLHMWGKHHIAFNQTKQSLLDLNCYGVLLLSETIALIDQV